MSKFIKSTRQQVEGLIDEYSVGDECAAAHIISTYAAKLDFKAVVNKFLLELTMVKSVKYWLLPSGLQIYAISTTEEVETAYVMSLVRGPMTKVDGVTRIDGISSYLDEVAVKTNSLGSSLD